MNIARKTRVLEGFTAESPPLPLLMSGAEPLVLKGLVKNWPLVRAGLGSHQEAMDYLRSFYNGKTVGTCVGEAHISGRLAYNADFTELNTASRRMRLDEVLNMIREHFHDERPPTFYIPSTTIDACLPGFRQENNVTFAGHGFEPLRSIWIGNRTIASCHYDAPNNLACCAVGQRRVTLLPPEQIFNLYPGPLEPTPGGQAISLVDFANPDFERYPRFREALASAQVAELQPGDAVYIPSMWWHHIEALSPFNTLVNYWWSTSPAYMPTPMNALYHALWVLRDRPEQEKRAWRNVFEYYVFGPSDRAGAHLPEQARGALGPIDDEKARQIRAMLLNVLNR
jgi:Cupin-like domain